MGVFGARKGLIFWWLGTGDGCTCRGYGHLSLPGLIRRPRRVGSNQQDKPQSQSQNQGQSQSQSQDQWLEPAQDPGRLLGASGFPVFPGFPGSPGFLASWLPWLPGFLASRLPGFLASWFQDKDLLGCTRKPAKQETCKPGNQPLGFALRIFPFQFSFRILPKDFP